MAHECSMCGMEHTDTAEILWCIIRDLEFLEDLMEGLEWEGTAERAAEGGAATPTPRPNPPPYD